MYGWILFIIFQITVISGISIITLREFISLRRTVWYASVFSGIGWALCFSIVLMIPVDIIDNDIDKKCEVSPSECVHPITYLPPTLLTVEWNVLYWGTFALSWFVFPFLQSYWLAGDFTKFDKFFTSFKENIYIYVIMGIVGGGGLVILAVKDNLNKADVRQLIVMLANIYGLFVVVLLLGYGLVDIPRYLLRKSNRSGWLKHYAIQTAVYKKEVEVTRAKLDDTLQNIRFVSQKISQENQLRPFVECILEKCPEDFKGGQQGGRFTSELDKEKMKYSYLVSLHQKVMAQDHAYTRASRLYEQIVSKALNLEDVLHSRNSVDKRVEWHFRAPRTGRFTKLRDVAEWLWQVYLYTWTFRLVGALCALLSLVVVWCEVVMPVQDKDLSPLSLIITQIPLTGLYKQVYCVVILAYMAICTYTSLFKLQIWDYYRLVPHQQSDANSIMFSANYLCRLAAPLSFNFLILTRQREAAPAFSKVMGEMDGFFKLGNNFMYLFPTFVALFCLCSLFNVWARVARSKFMKNCFKSCWPIKKLKIHIEDPQNLAEEGAAILRLERETREEHNTGVSFDSVGDISDRKNRQPPQSINKPEDRTKDSGRFGEVGRETGRFGEIGRDNATGGRFGDVGRDNVISGRFGDLGKESTTGGRFGEIGRDVGRERYGDAGGGRDIGREKYAENKGEASKPSGGRPSFSFGKNRYTSLRSDIP